MYIVLVTLYLLCVREVKVRVAKGDMLSSLQLGLISLNKRKLPLVGFTFTLAKVGLSIQVSMQYTVELSEHLITYPPTAVVHTCTCSSVLLQLTYHSICMCMTLLHHIASHCITWCQVPGSSSSKAHYSVVELKEGGRVLPGGTSVPSPSNSPDTTHKEMHDPGKVDNES